MDKDHTDKYDSTQEELEAGKDFGRGTRALGCVGNGEADGRRGRTPDFEVAGHWGGGVAIDSIEATR